MATAAHRAAWKVCTLLTLLPCLFACHNKAVAEQTPSEPSNRTGRARPIAELPATVKAPEGELTLFADFSQPRPDGIRVYLVNRMDRHIGFSVQGSNPYLKLEAKTDEVGFERAQPHYYSWCGNSYFGLPSLRSGEFFCLLGYQPKEGKSGEVRYRIYCEFARLLKGDESALDLFHQYESHSHLEKMPIHLVSNSGPGRFAVADIKLARNDSMTIRFGRFDAIRDMAIGAVKPSMRHDRWFRTDAVEALARFPTDESADVLAALVKNGVASEPAIRSLAKIGPECPHAEEIFQRLLHGEHVQNRAAAIASLALRQVTPEAIEFGKASLADPHPDIRTGAIAFLFQISKEHPQARRAILDHTDDPNPKVREMIEALHKSLNQAKSP